MTYELGAKGVERLETYFEKIGALLGEKRRRASFALYAMGILGEHERKSVEPLAAAAAEDPEAAQRTHDHLLHFIGQSEWEDRPVREFAARYAVHAMESRERVSAWVIDDTGFLKQGRESPGVQRQYTGSIGKIANCQIGVSLTLCTPTEHVPVDMQLYLPESWTSDRVRCDKAKIPSDMGFRPKWQIALEMMETAVTKGLPKGVALADAAYGNVGEFRAGLRWLGFEYAVGVNATTLVTRVSKAMSVEALAKKLPRSAFRATTWKQGSRRALWSRFAMLQVDVGNADPHWLLIEWPDGEKAPTHYTLAQMRKAPSRKQLVRITKQRWRTERVYQDLKGELGLDHYEGRSFRGWHHHVTVVLCCYAFVLGERLRHFPPSRGRARPRYSLECAA
ncbi:MAG: IS701-like element ISBj9 family transposase [Polyangiales bacterium]